MIRRNFNLNDTNTQQPVLVPITIHKNTKIVKDNKKKKNGLFSSLKNSKYLIRNLPQEEQVRAREKLKEFLNKPLEGVDNDDDTCHQEFPPKKLSFLFDKYKTNDEHVGEDFVLPDSFDSPNKNKQRSKRRRNDNDLELSQPIRRKKPDDVENEKLLFNKRNVRFEEAIFSSSISSSKFLKSIENIQPTENREEFLEDSTIEDSLKDLLCTELSPVSKMLEKRKEALNDGKKLSTQTKRGNENQWTADNLKQIAFNVSEGLPPLTLGNNSALTYLDAIKKVIKKISSNINKNITTTSEIPSELIEHARTISDATSPFIINMNDGINNSEQINENDFVIESPHNNFHLPFDLDMNLTNQSNNTFGNLSPNFFNT
uniref:Uncharacterized protein n=1 Tax=Parastrongyloides trichosuri TaxID=131310 RepID=A0A0N4Z1U0_PARTI